MMPGGEARFVSIAARALRSRLSNNRSCVLAFAERLRSTEPVTIGAREFSSSRGFQFCLRRLACRRFPLSQKNAFRLRRSLLSFDSDRSLFPARNAQDLVGRTQVPDLARN